MVPSKIFFTKGVGFHKEKLASFELALRDAGIEKFNLVNVSSILPPQCQIISREKGLKLLSPGEIVFCVMSRNESNESYRHLQAAIGLAVPSDNKTYGYLAEHHSFGETAKKAGEYSEEVAVEMLASTLGIKTKEGIKWDEKKEAYKLSGKILKTSHVVQSAEVPKSGLWASVIAAAVFVP